MSEGIYITLTNKESGAEEIPLLDPSQIKDSQNQIVIEKDGKLYRTSASVLTYSSASIKFFPGQQAMSTYDGRVVDSNVVDWLYHFPEIPKSASAILISGGMQGGAYPDADIKFWTHGQWGNEDYMHYEYIYRSRVAMWDGFCIWVPVHESRAQIAWKPNTDWHKGVNTTDRYLNIHAWV